MTRLLPILLVLGLGLGCSTSSGFTSGLWPFGRPPAPTVPPDQSFGLELVEDDAVIDFYGRASRFYSRLALRRVNTLATYRDEVLRDYFRSESAFSDYYADLAQELTDAWIERNRPLALDVVEFRMEGPGEARVLSRILGENGRPLRFWQIAVEREDRWERIEGIWWIVPEKL